MKRSYFLAAAVSLLFALTSFASATSPLDSTVNHTVNSQKQSLQQTASAPYTAQSNLGQWMYDESLAASRPHQSSTLTPAWQARPLATYETRSVDWQWGGNSYAQAGAAANNKVSLDKFALIALDGSDIAGNHDALIFAVLSVLSGLICLNRKKSLSA